MQMHEYICTQDTRFKNLLCMGGHMKVHASTTLFGSDTSSLQKGGEKFKVQAEERINPEKMNKGREFSSSLFQMMSS